MKVWRRNLTNPHRPEQKVMSRSSPTVTRPNFWLVMVIKLDSEGCSGESGSLICVFRFFQVPEPHDLFQVPELGAGRPAVFLVNMLKELLPQDRNVRRSLNPQPDLFAADLENLHADIISDEQ